MLRIFTKDHGRYKRGDQHDYPAAVWGKSLPGYEDFTADVAEALEEWLDLMFPLSEGTGVGPAPGTEPAPQERKSKAPAKQKADAEPVA